MKIFFHIPYKTAPGESLYAVLLMQTEHASLRRRIPLHSEDGQNWHACTELSPAQGNVFSYYYKVVKEQKTVRREWHAIPRFCFLNGQNDVCHLFDFWRDLPQQSWLFSAAVTPAKNIHPYHISHAPVMLRAFFPGINAGQKPFLCAEAEALGRWDPQKAVPLFPIGVNEWAVALNKEWLCNPFVYKFILKDENGNVQWEQGPNRTLQVPDFKDGECFVYGDLWPQFFLPPYRAAGVVLPVFSIRTEQDWGIGDFGSLKKLTDWAALTGQKMIQLLPVNDTTLTGTWQDSYPYNSVSVYALHPIYADLSSLPRLSAKEEKYFQDRRQRLNALEQIDYESVYKLKLERLRMAYKEQGQEILSSPQFRHFWQCHNTWLAPYAMFSALRDRFGTPDFSTWPRHKTFADKDLKKFFASDSKDRQNAYFYFYVQFLLHEQLSKAHHYAKSKHIALKGDIPIGVSPHSAETWQTPALFNLNTQAGAPPDDFSKTGQNWGLPTYNWAEMAKNGYDWWRKRFLHMSLYFDAYRIDHVLGFFRIWEIPLHAVQGLLGQFAPSIPLSAREISFAGLAFSPLYLRPYISQKLLDETFGAEAEFVKKTYLQPTADGLFALKDAYNTQRKIEAAFKGKTDPNAQKMRDGLYRLVTEVLFLPDHQNPQLYHPRISALESAAFHALSPKEQQAYTRLYNDYFYHRQDNFWKQQAFQKSPALTQSTPMLCCAEDLGMIPHCVPEVMHALQMLSLEIQRMPKQPGQTFADTQHYPYLSVATPGTHDMSVLRGWWKENPALSARFWQEVLHHSDACPADLPADACEQILRLHLQSPSMLCLISFQDWTSIDASLAAADPQKERINVPANPHHYWRYRMHISVEELMKKEAFNQKIKKMIEQSAR